MAATTTPSELAAATQTRRWQIFKPSLGDFLIFLTLFWAFLAYPGSWTEFNGDADTGLHIRTGEYVLTHHWVPTQDLYSFSKPHETWYAFEWLSCTIYAALHGAVGLPGILALSAIMIVLLPFLWLRDSLARGATPMLALPLIFLGYRAASIHFLARPHVFTLLIFSIAVAMIESDRRRNSRALWFLVPLTILWTNLHGGFAILPVYLGVLVAGQPAGTQYSGRKAVRALNGPVPGCIAGESIRHSPAPAYPAFSGLVVAGEYGPGICACDHLPRRRPYLLLLCASRRGCSVLGSAS